MGAYHLILREGFLDTFPTTVAGTVDGLIKPSQLAEVLQIAVHQLVGQDRQRQVVREGLLLIFLQDLLGKTVQLDGQAVIGFHRGDIHHTVLDVGPLEVGHVRITEAGESAKAETVPCLGKAAGILYHLLILVAVHVRQRHLGSVLGNLEIIKVQQLLLSQEDDRLVQDLELGPIPLDGVLLDGVLLGVVLPERPVQEPAQVIEMLLDTLLLQALVAEVNDKLVDAGLVEGLEGGLGVEALHMIGERMPDLQRCICPAIGSALLLDEFFQAGEEADTLHLHRNRILLRLHLQRLLQVLLDFLLSRLLLQVHLPLREMGLDLLQVGIDPLGRDFLGILITLRLHLVSIPVIGIDGVPNRGLKGNALH